jgi:hypothetical protein
VFFPIGLFFIYSIYWICTEETKIVYSSQIIRLFKIFILLCTGNFHIIAIEKDDELVDSDAYRYFNGVVFALV